MSADQIKGISMMLAPSLVHKFDYSNDKDFTDWAVLSIKAAKAFGVEFDKAERLEAIEQLKSDDSAALGLMGVPSGGKKK